MVHFVLSALESEVTLDVSASIPTDPSMSLDVSAVAIQYITLDSIKAIFKYQTDSNDAIDADSSDLKYYVDSDEFELLTSLNPANAVLSSDEIASSDSAGLSLENNKKMVAHDFLRYLAEDLFGTHYGVDIFNNELSVLNSIRSVCGDAVEGNTWYDIKAAIKKVSMTEGDSTLTGIATDDDGNKYMTNEFGESEEPLNLCRVLMRQMLGLAPSRFAEITASGDKQSLPFQLGDTIGFKLTINAAADQHLITRDEDVVPPRSYEIRWVISDDDSNTAVADDEL